MNINAVLVVLILVVPVLALAGGFENSQAYKSYMELPEKYRSPEAEKLYRKGYEAEEKVKNLPCKKGGTVAQYLDKKAAVPAVEDLGWITRPMTMNPDEGFYVDRLMLLNQTMKLEYKWEVNGNGTVKAVNGKAIRITK